MSAPSNGPSPHLSWLELACVNRMTDKRNQPITWKGHPPGSIIEAYPLEKRETFGMKLGAIHETMRRACSVLLGRETPLAVGSAYRTVDYDKDIGGVSGWHVQAGAIDIHKPAALTELQWWELAKAQVAGPLAAIVGGLGRYDWGAHFDVRPLTMGRLTMWDYRAKK